MNNKISNWLMIFFLTGSIFTSMFVTLPNNNIVLTASADEVVWENEYGRLEVWPETSTNLIRQEQYCNITWYKPNNTIDVAFRFNHSLTGGKIQYWNNDQWNTVTLSYTTYNDKHYYYYQGFNVVQDATYRFRWYYNVQPMTSGKWDFMAKLSSDSISEALSSGRYILLDPWYSSDWEKVKDCYIDHTQVPTALTNFPVLINLSSTEMMGDVQDDLGDIVFTNSANDTIQPHDLDWYEIDATHVKALIWVNVSSVNGVADGSDTHIRMYYKNSGCSNQQDPGGTWNSDYEFVYHLNETTGATHADDSTSNANNGSLNGTIPVQRAVRIGNGQLLDGTDDYIHPVCNGANITNAGTIEFWVDLQGATADQYFCNIHKDAGHYVRMDTGGSSKWVYIGDGGTDNEWSNTTLDVNSTLEQVVYTWDDNDVKMFVSGNQIYVSLTATLDAYTPQTFWFGENQNGDDDLNALMDEIRASSVRRSDSWIVAGYNTVNNMTGATPFVTISGEVDWSAGATDPVTFFNVSTNSKTQMTLNWTQSTNGNYTYIERNSISSWSRGTGTFVYNATNTGTVDTNVTAYTVYYYRAWAFNESTHNFSAYTLATNHTGPLNPTNINPSLSGGTLNFTWTKGTRGEITVIVRKHNSFPSSISDGTQVYNGSATGFDDTVFNTSSYYTFYGFNNLTSLSSSGVQAQWGVLQIRVYDENTSEVIYNYTVHVTNQSGSEAYEIYSANTQVVNIGINNLPTGEDVLIRINATGYSDRVYYYDISPNTFYNVSAYLSESLFDCVLRTYTDSKAVTNHNNDLVITFTYTLETMINVEVYNETLFGSYGGWLFVSATNYSFTTTQLTIGAGVFDVNTTMARVNYYYEFCGGTQINLYYIRVINVYSEPVNEVLVEIKRYINSTSGYDIITSDLTDANGYITVYLEPSINYKVTLSKTGYETVTNNYPPDPDYYGIVYPKEFTILETVVEPVIKTFGDLCDLSGSWASNESLYVTFTDLFGETIDIQFKIYESYNGTRILNETINYIGESNISFYVEGLNSTRAHDIVIWHNHTTIGYTPGYSVTVLPLKDYEIDEDYIEDKLTEAVGEFELGYVKFFLIWIPAILILLGCAAVNLKALGIIGSGIWCVGSSWYINLNEEQLIINLGILFALLVLLGALKYISKHKRSV